MHADVDGDMSESLREVHLGAAGSPQSDLSLAALTPPRTCVQPASCRYCGICVVLPLPVSPTTMVVACVSTEYRI